jgi:hypothetical protein
MEVAHHHVRAAEGEVGVAKSESARFPAAPPKLGALMGCGPAA